MSSNPKLFEAVFNEYKSSGEIQDFGKDLGKGAFGLVKDVKYKNKMFAGKLVMKDTSEEDKLTSELRGPNIIRIQKICKPKTKNGSKFHLVIMEKAILRDLDKLNAYFHKYNLLKLKVDNIFDEKLEDTLLRYYTKQLIGGLETLFMNNYVHFDIKPDNILITVNLTLKLSDFSILKKVDDNVEEFKIPGGTAGYMSPEYYMGQKLTAEQTRTQDIFALGSTLLLLKFGEPFLKYRKYEDKSLIADKITEILIRRFNNIETKELIDEELVHFFNKLVNFKPGERYNFEQLYRNKWLNKNWEYIDNVVANFENDEEKLLMELQKQDFIIRKEKNIKYVNEKLLKKPKNCRSKKFKFKKKEDDIFSQKNILKIMDSINK